MTRNRLILPLALGVFALSLYVACTHLEFNFTLNYLDFLKQFNPVSSGTTRIMTTSPLAGWHARGLAHPYPNPHSFEPRRDALKFALLRNNPVEPEGFSLAVFERGHDSAYVVVDALGRVMLLPSSSSDVNGLLALGRQTVDLPSTGEFRNTWFIAQPTTSQSIDRFLFVSPGAQDGVVETSVSGYSSTLTELRDPVNGYTRLPDVLQELFGVLLEARVGYQERRGGGDGDQTVLRKVRRALDDLL